jgi:hypothetical protein
MSNIKQYIWLGISALALLVAPFMMMSCSTKTGSVDLNTEKIKYVYDSRTGLCFAVAGSRKAIDFNSSGMGMACVPCNPRVIALAQAQLPTEELVVE